MVTHTSYSGQPIAKNLRGVKGRRARVGPAYKDVIDRVEGPTLNRTFVFSEIPRVIVKQGRYDRFRKLIARHLICITYAIAIDKAFPALTIDITA
jgi:hypothetical protein